MPPTITAPGSPRIRLWPERRSPSCSPAPWCIAKLVAVGGGERVQHAVPAAGENHPGDHRDRGGQPTPGTAACPAAAGSICVNQAFIPSARFSAATRAGLKRIIDILFVRRAAPHDLAASAGAAPSDRSAFHTSAPFLSGSTATTPPPLCAAIRTRLPPASVFNIGELAKSQSGPGCSGHCSPFGPRPPQPCGDASFSTP